MPARKTFAPAKLSAKCRCTNPKPASKPPAVPDTSKTPTARDFCCTSSLIQSFASIHTRDNPIAVDADTKM
jgi:hypothetical protein